MALRINHNLAAINANRNLKMTTAHMSKSMQKLSSGFRINQAADDPAGLVISEQFRSQIAGLNRAIQNSEGSISMIQTAEGALTEINNLLISMRELAIHASNEGFNDDDQLAADQAEIANAIKTIDRIAANTQFGTKKILDGSKDNIATITSANSSGLTIQQSFLSNGKHSVTATKTADSSSTLNTTSLGLSLRGIGTDGDPNNLEEKIHNIDIVQASDAAKKTGSSFDLTDAFGNNLEVAASADKAIISSGAAAAAAANGTTGHAGTYTFNLNYQENGESVTGNQALEIEIEAGDSIADVATKLNAQISLNSRLAGKIVARATAGTNPLRIEAANEGSQYSIEALASSTTATTAFVAIGSSVNDRGASANLLNFTVNSAKHDNRTANVTVGAATYSSYDALVTAINTALRTTGGAGGFGTVSGGGATDNDVLASVVNNDQVQFATRDEGSAYSIKLNAGVAGTGNLRNVLGLTEDTLANAGTDALVNFGGYSNAVNKVDWGANRDITLYNADADSSARGSIDLQVATAQNGINVGNLLLDVKAAKFDVRLNGGPATSVTAGVNSTVFNADRSESLIVNYSLTSTGGTEQINNSDSSLVFQIGANVGQTASIGIRNMSAGSLSKGVAGNMFASLAEIDVTTVQGAQDAQTLIDAAIDEVSTTRGTLGSFQKNTLESNLRNLRIASQNLTASESQIRDTDMAEEMSEFTKNQILVQAGTAMLAQANQVPQTVLSLF